MRTGRTPGPLPWATLSAMVTTGASCVRCGSREDLVAHHKVPRRHGGLDLLENLEPVCRRCHPAVERDAAAEGALVWERPESDGQRRGGPRPSLTRPY